MLKKIKKKFGLFGFLFPIIIAIIGAAIVAVCFYETGFDVLSWLRGPHAVIAYFAIAIILLVWANVWFRIGGSKK
jgi:uncharacterized membrane protein YeaQ/YmgE (transglycosylase-associated protein family)